VPARAKVSARDGKDTLFRSDCVRQLPGCTRGALMRKTDPSQHIVLPLYATGQYRVISQADGANLIEFTRRSRRNDVEPAHKKRKQKKLHQNNQQANNRQECSCRSCSSRAPSGTIGHRVSTEDATGPARNRQRNNRDYIQFHSTSVTIFYKLSWRSDAVHVRVLSPIGRSERFNGGATRQDGT